MSVIEGKQCSQLMRKYSCLEATTSKYMDSSMDFLYKMAELDEF